MQVMMAKGQVRPIVSAEAMTAHYWGIVSYCESRRDEDIDARRHHNTSRFVVLKRASLREHKLAIVVAELKVSCRSPNEGRQRKPAFAN